MRYLLDTNAVSDLVRHPQGRVAERIRAVSEYEVCTSIIVACELRFGARKKGSRKLTAQLEAILAAISVLPLELPADEEYGKIRAELEGAGTPIGANDLLIAAQALSLGLILVTDNEREFLRIKRLRCENWLREP